MCVFMNYNGHWESTSRYVGGDMKGILVPEAATYHVLLRLVRNTMGICLPDTMLVMRYVVDPVLPPVTIQCDADVKFYIQLKKRDVHVLSKFPISIDVLEGSAAVAMPPDIGGSNHIDDHPCRDGREGGQSDEAIQPVTDQHLMQRHDPLHTPILPPDLHYIHGSDHQHNVLNHGGCAAHDDCGSGRINLSDSARHSIDRSIPPSVGAHSIAPNILSQSNDVPSSSSLDGPEVVADDTPITPRVNCVFESKRLLQFHLHHDAMSKHYQFKVKRSNSTLLHVICIDNTNCQWQLRATRMRGSELFVVKRFDDVHTCSLPIVQGHHRQAKSWIIGECVKSKYVDPTNTSYRPREIMRDMQAEYGVSFNYLRAWRAKEAALTSLRGNDAESYRGNIYCQT